MTMLIFQLLVRKDIIIDSLQKIMLKHLDVDITFDLLQMSEPVPLALRAKLGTHVGMIYIYT